MTSSGPVRVENHGRILVATLNRPEVRNAVNAGVASALAGAWDTLDADPELRVGVLTGAPPIFCAGMDLKAFAAGEHMTDPVRGFAGTVDRPPEKPLIAAVEGAALGGGLELMLACDLVVASEGTQFGLPEAKLGLAALAGGLRTLPRRIPYQLAMEMALTAEPIPAWRAREAGLVSRLVPPGEALAAAIELAESIAVHPLMGVRTSKRLVSASARGTDAEARALEETLRDELARANATKV